MVAKLPCRTILLAGIVLVLVLSACSSPAPAPASPTPPATEEASTQSPPKATSTSVPPSPTVPPLAARVNGEGIWLEDYEAELVRYAAASGVASPEELAEEDRTRVLQNMIEELLLAQAAVEAGYEGSEAALQERIDRLGAQVGSPQALQEWITAQGYTEESFRRSLERAAAAAWMRDRILDDLPETAEQVHARQVLLPDAQTAAEAIARLEGGVDFATLASEYDPLTGGDLGWFPRGYLPDAGLEEAAFSLEPGQYSPVIQTAAGYHILQVIGREADRPLEADARLALQFRALQSWLDERRSASEIEILVA